MIKNPPANAGDLGLILGLGQSAGGGNDNSFQFSHLGNPMDRGGMKAVVNGQSYFFFFKASTTHLVSSSLSSTSWHHPHLLIPYSKLQDL